MARIGIIVREGLLFGVLGGILAVIVLVDDVLVTNNLNTSAFADFVTSSLTLLIIGGAGRKIAAITESSTAAIQMGALAGGVIELFRVLGGSLVISYLPAAQTAVEHMSAAERAISNDPAKWIPDLAFALALAIVFGAIIGWLGAWSLLQFRGPRKPPR